MQIWMKLDLVVSKLAWGIRWSFIKALKNLKICNLMGSFCPKCNALARKFWRNYVSWHWKLMQNLSENWVVAWKMTRNLVWKFALNGFLLSKGYKILDEKLQKSCLSWHLSDAKFEGKLAHGFKNYMTNLLNFNASSGKSENLHFDVLLLSIVYIKFQLKKCRRVISHDTEEWSKLRIKTHFLINFNSNSGKSENLHFDGILLSKVCNVWTKIIQVSSVVKNDLWFQIWHKEFGEFSHK